MAHLFCFGFGYTAQFLSNSLLKKGFKITATYRENVGKKDGITYIKFDDKLSIPNDVTHIIVSIPPHQGEDIVINRYKNQIESLDCLRWCMYLSSTGVYGDHNGAWVDENSSINSDNDTGIFRYNAECQWMNLYYDKGLPIHIFRLSGIYGIGRNCLEEIINNKAYTIDEKDILFSRIYIKDLIAIIEKSMNNTTPGEIYNISDNQPAASIDVVKYACNILHVKTPKLVSLQDAIKHQLISNMGVQFYKSRKKVSNNKIKTALDWSPAYPTYIEGIDDIAMCLLHNCRKLLGMELDCK